VRRMVKGRQWWERVTSGRLVLRVLGITMSGLLGPALGVHSQSLVGPGAGRVLQVLGSTITVKLDGEQTAGRYAVIEEVSPVDDGPPLHVHHHEKVLVVIIPACFVGFFDAIQALAQPTSEQLEALEQQYEVRHFLPLPTGN
jgi:hypothetical protein